MQTGDSSRKTVQRMKRHGVMQDNLELNAVLAYLHR